MILLWQKLNKLAEQLLGLIQKLLLVIAVLNVGVGGTVVVQANSTQDASNSNELVHIQFLGLGHIHSTVQSPSYLTLPQEHQHHSTSKAQQANFAITEPGKFVALGFSRTSSSLQASDRGLSELQKIGSSYCLAELLKALLVLGWLGYLARLRQLKLANPFLAIPEKPPRYFSPSFPVLVLAFNF